MDAEMFQLHIEAGLRCGKEHTCGNKINYLSEDTASKAANALNTTGKARHKVEPYPCAFCNGWHIGREISVEEMQKIIRINP